MTSRRSARPLTRRTRIRRRRAAGVLAAVVAVTTVLGSTSLVSSSLTAPSRPTVPSPFTVPSRSTVASPPTVPSRPAMPPPSTAPSPSRDAPRADGSRKERRAPSGEAGGAVPDGTTVFDDEVPGVVNLEPALRRALRRAATDAAGEGVELVVDSGWRTSAYQARLLREAVARYGSEQEAARWVATPDTSAHVSGDAVDIGPPAAAAWLSRHGAAFGLCQIYRNEPWHYELRPDAVAHGCPPMYADPTQDPRMQP